MSEYIFKLPDLGEGTVESEIAEWFVKVGDDVAEEDVVGTMMTDKAAVEVSSPVSGKVVSLAGEPGDMISVGAPLIVFETSSAQTPQAEINAAPQRTDTPPAAPPTAPEPSAKPSRVITSPAIRLTVVGEILQRFRAASFAAVTRLPSRVTSAVYSNE